MNKVMKEITIKVGEKGREYDLGFSGRYIDSVIDRSMRYELKLYQVRYETPYMLVGKDDQYTLVQMVSDCWLVKHYPDLARMAHLPLTINLDKALNDFPLNLTA